MSRGPEPAPDPGIWLDIAVQALIIGLLLGLVAMWLGTWRRSRTRN